MLPVLGLCIPSVFPLVTITLIIKECEKAFVACDDKNVIYSRERSFSPVTKLSGLFGFREKEF